MKDKEVIPLQFRLLFDDELPHVLAAASTISSTSAEALSAAATAGAAAATGFNSFKRLHSVITLQKTAKAFHLSVYLFGRPWTGSSCSSCKIFVSKIFEINF